MAVLQGGATASHRSRIARTALPAAMSSAVSRDQPASRLEEIASNVSCISRRRWQLLAPLLRVAIPDQDGEDHPLRQLWADEGVLRACNLIRLTVALDRWVPIGREDTLVLKVERAVAESLAASFQSLETDNTEEPLPCSGVLRTVVCNLVELFGAAVGEIALHMSVERLALPAVERRALVAAASELVINALRHGVAGDGTGHIAVRLHRGHGSAMLSVSDRGPGYPVGAERRPHGIAFDLAALLGSRLVYSRADGGGLRADIRFPIGETARHEPERQS